MAVVVSGLSSPEALVAWKPLSGAGAGAGGLRLYWSDVGANRIDTCFLVGTGDTLLKCGEVTALQHWSKRPHGSAPPRLLYLLTASLAAQGSSALPKRGRLTGHPATTASGARASRLVTAFDHAGSAVGRASGDWAGPRPGFAGAARTMIPLHLPQLIELLSS